MSSHETKFVAHRSQTGFALAWLRHACIPDTEFPRNVVHSLYYDSSTLSSYREKANGDALKTKIRLRWYQPDLLGESALCTTFLEIKKKDGPRRQKHRAKLVLDRTWLESADLDDTSFMSLLHSPGAADAGVPIPSGFMPSLVVRYNRHRFTCPETMARVCLDTDIGAHRASRRLLPRWRPVEIPRAVVEIKGPEIRDIHWLEKLYAAGFRGRSFSKFGECVSQMLMEE